MKLPTLDEAVETPNTNGYRGASRLHPRRIADGPDGRRVADEAKAVEDREGRELTGFEAGAIAAACLQRDPSPRPAAEPGPPPINRAGRMAIGLAIAWLFVFLWLDSAGLVTFLP